MIKVSQGQCGMCQFFGRKEGEETSPQLLEILSTSYASEELVAPCGHDQLSPHSLRVTPMSGCSEFEKAH